MSDSTKRISVNITTTISNYHIVEAESLERARLEALEKHANNTKELRHSEIYSSSSVVAFENTKMKQKPKISYNKTGKNFWANCGKCGALLYTAEHLSTFKEVFKIERGFCYHCGSEVDSEIENLDCHKTALSLLNNSFCILREDIKKAREYALEDAVNSLELKEKAIDLRLEEINSLIDFLVNKTDTSL